MVVLGGLVGFLVGAMRWADRLADRAEALELVRTVWMILDEELRPGLPDRDWSLVSDRAVELRAFRGVGRVCGPGDGMWPVAYRGLRAPDPARDSLLVLGSDGGWRAAALGESRRGVGACQAEPGEEEHLLSWAPEGAPAPLLVRVFERGRYSLEDGAFRYRRGSGGRQPLTPERVDAWSHFGERVGGLEVHLRVRGWGPIPKPGYFHWVVASDGAMGL